MTTPLFPGAGSSQLPGPETALATKLQELAIDKRFRTTDMVGKAEAEGINTGRLLVFSLATGRSPSRYSLQA